MPYHEVFGYDINIIIMTVKFSDVISKTDLVKISILLVFAIGCWGWVWVEFQKPIFPEGFNQDHWAVEPVANAALTE